MNKCQEILDKIQKPYKTADRKLIAEAFGFAKKAHGEQKRESGEDYIAHPLHTALTLSEMNADAKTVAAGLLHDVLDDTGATKKQLEEKFGEEVVFLVEGVSKLGKIKYRGVERHAENLRKMLLAMAQDFRVVLIKLADRYHNLQTLDALPAAKQKRIALESLEIYAPLAFRFGVSELSKKIEDLAFKYCYPQEYNLILSKVEALYPEREKYLEEIKPYVLKELKKEGIIPVEIQTRAKHYWSLYEKLKKYNMNWDAIYDLVAMRIIVKDIEQCYGALGVIHKLCRPLPGRIKDYIALPKPNGYQSLHTTAFCKGGNITEFQIRTRNMHDAAENGIAAHWLYTETNKPKGGAKANRKEFAWVAQIRDWQQEIRDSADFLDTLKIDVFSNRIFVFTPRGDVIDLPEGATPIDFAYAIHSSLGDTCSSAKVNKEMVSLDCPLKNGDMVEIIKDPKKKPSRDWLLFVKTNTARARIRAHLKEARREEKIQEGKLLLDRELEKFNQGTWDSIPQKQKGKIFQNLPYRDEGSLISAVGEGDISPYRVIKYAIDEKKILAQRVIPALRITSKKNTRNHDIRLLGTSGIKTRIALCCSPIPGEGISGYITQRSCASIHKSQCANLRRLGTKNPNRVITASWQAQKGANFVKIKIAAFDRVGLLQEISSSISNMGVNIISISAEGESDSDAWLIATVEVFDIDQLHILMRNLEKIKSVREVKRA
ncbi:MAG: bifunctional (p)ppGpp synthetase/guanosine-3',5'-bis(diphosphate) 3'-pyrophosphohydrolase [Candidatus Spechtbacterales bacterium]